MVKPVACISRQKSAPIARKAGASTMFFLTDSTRARKPEKTIKKLPTGSIVVVRDYEHPDRRSLCMSLASIAKRQKCRLFVAGDLELAKAVKADGFHLPEHMLSERTAIHKAKTMGLLVSAACHNRAALRRAEVACVDYALVSPVFATNSHPGALPLGMHRFARLIDGTTMPIVALGGIEPKTVGTLKGLRLGGIAGISGIV